MLQESTRNLLLDRLEEKTRERNEAKRIIQANTKIPEPDRARYSEYYEITVPLLDHEIEIIRETIIHDEIQ